MTRTRNHLNSLPLNVPLDIFRETTIWLLRSTALYQLFSVSLLRMWYLTGPATALISYYSHEGYYFPASNQPVDTQTGQRSSPLTPRLFNLFPALDSRIPFFFIPQLVQPDRSTAPSRTRTGQQASPRGLCSTVPASLARHQRYVYHHFVCLCLILESLSTRAMASIEFL